MRKLTEEEALLNDKKAGFLRTSPYISTRHKCIYLCPCCNHPFQATPSSIWQLNTKSCGCSASSRRFDKLHKDYTNMRFGKLVAKRYLYKNKHKKAVWEFLCDCGKLTQHVMADVVNGRIKSCGCLAKELIRELSRKRKIHPSLDITNRRFGRLVAIKDMGSDGKSRIWLCRCDCGNTKLLSTYRLSVTQSCGCLQLEAAVKKNTKDVIGNKYGKLTVIENVSGSKRKCRCECGNIIIVNFHSLQRGATQSCGCSRISRGESKIRNILDTMGIEYETEKSFDWCKDKTRLRFDFYIPSHNIVIEYQGIIHFSITGGWHTKERLAQCQRRDQIKRHACSTNSRNVSCWL